MCKHPNCTIDADVLSKTIYHVACKDRPYPHIVSSDPLTLRVSAVCPDCDFSGIYNGYAVDKLAGASSWPKWLLNHMRTLCEVDDELLHACIACHVPGIQAAV